MLGRLDVDALQKSLYEVVRRHQALRTRIVLHDGEPMQEIQDMSRASAFTEVIALSERDPWEDTFGQIRSCVLEPVDVAIGPLFVARLLELSDEEHVLVTTMEHLVSDQVSQNVVLQDVMAAYAQLSQGQPVSWPCGTVQFPEYAQQQRSQHPKWLEQQGPYWEQRMRGCPRHRFPNSANPSSGTVAGWEAAPIRIDKEQATQLRHWCRAHGTTMAMAVLTAYVALVSCWCDVADTVIQFETEGRCVPGTENAIGSFASSLGLRVNLLEDDHFLSLLDRVTEEFCAAYEHHDHSYLAAQSDPPGWTRNTMFNWVPAGSGFTPFEPAAGAPAISVSPVHFPNPWIENLTRDNEPTTVLFDGPSGIDGAVYYSRHEHSEVQMKRFVEAFQLNLRHLVSYPRTRIRTIRRVTQDA